jgi:hypothetical protein
MNHRRVSTIINFNQDRQHKKPIFLAILAILAIYPATAGKSPPKPEPTTCPPSPPYSVNTSAEARWLAAMQGEN